MKKLDVVETVELVAAGCTILFGSVQMIKFLIDWKKEKEIRKEMIKEFVEETEEMLVRNGYVLTVVEKK